MSKPQSQRFSLRALLKRRQTRLSDSMSPQPLPKSSNDPLRLHPNTLSPELLPLSLSSTKSPTPTHLFSVSVQNPSTESLPLSPITLDLTRPSTESLRLSITPIQEIPLPEYLSVPPIDITKEPLSPYRSSTESLTLSQTSIVSRLSLIPSSTESSTPSLVILPPSTDSLPLSPITLTQELPLSESLGDSPIDLAKESSTESLMLYPNARGLELAMSSSVHELPPRKVAESMPEPLIPSKLSDPPTTAPGDTPNPPITVSSSRLAQIPEESSDWAFRPFVQPTTEPNAEEFPISPGPDKVVVSPPPPVSHSALTRKHSEPDLVMSVDPTPHVSDPPGSLSLGEIEHAADDDGIEWHGQDKQQLPIEISSRPEAFEAPMMFPPHKYVIERTSRNLVSTCSNLASTVSAPMATEALPIKVDNVSSAGTTTSKNSIESRQGGVVALPAGSGVQPVPEPRPVEQFNIPIPQAASIGTSSSNFWDGAIIDIPLPPPSEVGFPMPVQTTPSGLSATGKSNRCLSGEFIGYDTGADDSHAYPQPSTSSLEITPNYEQVQHTQSVTNFASHNEDPIGPLPIPLFRAASAEWREYLLPDGTRYFSNPTPKITTDVDLRDIERLDAVTRFLNGRGVEILTPPEWELWLRNGSESTTGFTPLMAWVHHGSRMVQSWSDMSTPAGPAKPILDFVFARPASDPRHPIGKDVDKIESEHQYWSFVMAHPVHITLPAESVHEAINVLTWFHTSQPQQSPHPSPPPFSQEECQEWLTQLRSFSHMSTPAVVRTRVVSSVLFRIVAWRRGRRRDCATFQDPRENNNVPSADISLPRTRGEFTISFVCSGLPNFSWSDHIVKVSAREVAYVVLLIVCFLLGRLLA